MKIGLIDVDCHAEAKQFGATIYPNLALCKIAAYHRAQGDVVEWGNPMDHYDILYMSKIFNFTPDDRYIYNADRIIKGGTGYDITIKLPQEIDDMQPDFSIYPNVPADTSYGFLTRGCSRRCKWCVVPRKEGRIHPYWDIDRVANGRKKVVLMDNNILAAGDYAVQQLRKIIAKGYRIDFNQAMDARLVTPEFAELLAQVKWIDNRIRFGCDTKQQVQECWNAMKLIDSYGYKGEYFMYCMLHGKFEECYRRLDTWWCENQFSRSEGKRPRIHPYAQPYRDPQAKNTPPQWQKDMAHWCNNKAIFSQCDFRDFEPRKGFKCSEYLKEYGIKR